MKKNAFTLIELIATIALLAMLATIVITVAVKKINETKEKSREMLIESIELAAITYVTENTEELINFQKNDYIYVTLKTLVEKEYFTASLIDQTTKKSLPITDTVYVTRNQNGTITATYDINQRQKAQMILNGAYNEYLKVGSEYIEKGVLATASDGSDISTSITTSGSVDTTQEGTYVVTYTYNNQKITRNVIVYQGEGPSETIKPIEYVEFTITAENRHKIGYTEDENLELVIPATFKDTDGTWYKVTSIGSVAFMDCKNIISITIPKTITTIGEASFLQTTNLVSIFVDSGNSNFKSVGGILYNKDLTTLICAPANAIINIPDTVTSISSYGLDHVNATTIVLPSGLISIGDYAFTWSKITEITLPDTVTSVGEGIFSTCMDLVSVNLSRNLTYISPWMFRNCHNLLNINLHDGITSIGEWAFSSCLRMKTISLPQNITSIEDYTFYQSGLNSIVIPNSVTIIGESAFSETNLNGEIVIPNSVTTIKDKAFAGNVLMSSVHITSNVISVGNSIFYMCDSLWDIYYDGTEEQFNSVFENAGITDNITIHYN